MSFDVLFAPAFSLLGQSASPIEMLAFVTGVACVWLAVKVHIANWPIGLVSVACYSVVFFQAKLYADALLQIVFFATSVYGWWCWSRGKADPNQGIVRARAVEWVWLVGLTLAGALAVSWYLRTFTDSPLPTLDASILCISLAALWWQAQKVVECWWLWILVDLISIPVYWSRHLGLTALLYCIFLVMCIQGLREWRAKLPGKPLTGQQGAAA